MLNNRKNILILIIGILILVFAYYNQEEPGFGQNSVSTSEINFMDSKNSEETSLKKKEDNQIIVHLAGAVRNPGVYKLNKNDRLVDLIKAAGGLEESADLEQLNLAERLYDGQKLNIPESRELAAQNTISGDFNIDTNQSLINNYSASDNLVNINQALQNDLENLSGIGPSKAAAIIKYRDENGFFSEKEGLLKISGIGEKTLENIKDEIVVR